MIGKIGNLANEFQKYYFKADIDKQLDLGFQDLPQKDREIFVKYEDCKNIEVEIIDKMISKFCRERNIQERDICIISSNIETAREIDYYYREHNLGKNTQSTFEKQETFNKLKNETPPEILNSNLDDIRRSKKYHFHVNPGCVKFSTIHSFKGWESPYIFLILNKGDSSDKLIYTAITRARYGLYVINLGNSKYDDFFVEFISRN